MNKDLISIIIPVYNTGLSAKRLIIQLLSDAYKNIEIIVVDDGSKDGSLGILNTIKDERLRIFSKKNGGAASARNYGIKKTKGKYIIFLDSDDLISKKYLTELHKGINEDPKNKLAVTSVKYCRVKRNEEKNVYLRNIKRGRKESLTTYILRMLVIDGRIYSSTNKIYEAEIIKKNNLQFDEGRDFAEDTHFVLKYLKATGDCKIKLILKPLYYYYFGTETSTVKKSSTKWENWEESYKDVLEWVGNERTIGNKTLLKLLRLRWRISYYRSVKRSR